MAKAKFTGGVYESEINVRDFIQKNYMPYEGGSEFLSGPTKAHGKNDGKSQCASKRGER